LFPGKPVDDATAAKCRGHLHKQGKAVPNQRVTNESWRELLTHAELAAKQGKKQLLLLRFPSGVCSDGGRTIANLEEGWERTLSSNWSAALRVDRMGDLHPPLPRKALRTGPAAA
jgi:hypothetical protein